MQCPLTFFKLCIKINYMFFRKMLTWKDLAENPIKKILFILIGFLVLIVGIFIGIKINITNDFISRLYSLFIASIGFVYFIIPVIFTSFNKPIYLIKNRIFAIIFPALFNWGSFVLYMLLNRTEQAAMISLILAFNGYVFSGIRSDIIINKAAFYTHYFFNWLFSRFFLMLFLILNFTNLLRVIRKYI